MMYLVIMYRVGVVVELETVAAARTDNISARRARNWVIRRLISLAVYR